jgi:hypothetical protein
MATIWVDTWANDALIKSHDAPSWKSVRRPGDGWTPRPTRDHITGQTTYYDVEDVFGTREEGARFHTHFQPLYPSDISREVIIRDYFADMRASMLPADAVIGNDWRYANAVVNWKIDPKTDAILYSGMLYEFVDTTCKRFIDIMEISFHHEVSKDTEKRYDCLLMAVIMNPLKPASLRTDLTAAFDRYVSKNCYSVHTAEMRASLFEICIEGMLKY